MRFAFCRVKCCTSLKELEVYVTHPTLLIVDVFGRAFTLFHLVYKGKNQADYFVLVSYSFFCQIDGDIKFTEVILTTRLFSTLQTVRQVLSNQLR